MPRGRAKRALVRQPETGGEHGTRPNRETRGAVGGRLRESKAGGSGGTHLALPGVSGQLLHRRFQAEGMESFVTRLTDQHLRVIPRLPAGAQGT